MLRFRYKKSIPLDYNRQGDIYFISRRYRKLGPEKRRVIRQLCREAGGEYSEALLKFVTTDKGATEVCRTYFLSESTLERLVMKYYIAFDEQFDFA